MSGLSSWTSGDWMALALAEAPTALVEMMVAVRLLERSPNNRWRGP